MIHGANLKKDFYPEKRKVSVLKGVDIDVMKSDTVCIFGPSGVGKTTLLQILGLMEEPTSGKLEVFGRDVNELSESEKSKIRNEKIGFVFQFHYLMSEFNIFENLSIPSMIYNRKVSREHIRTLADAFGIGEMLWKYPMDISGGEAQRVAVVRALVNDPELIIADEPFGNLDASNKEKICKLLFDIVERKGITLILATHDFEVAKRCKKIMHLSDGKIKC